jgi:glycosyltransferase involved in cell wall biosynthesis
VAEPAERPAASRAGVLLYGMYDISNPTNAPKVRISMMLAALGGQGPVEAITGGRARRTARAARWFLGGGFRRVGAVYVEAATSSPMPTDLAFLAAMRLLRKPVGVYFRDAYPLFRAVHPRTRRSQVATDALWRVTTPMLKRLATVRFTPSAGLAAALRLGDAVLLPPGTDPSVPDLGIGDDDVVGSIVQAGPTSGFDRLLQAMALVRQTRPAARLRVVSASRGAAALPEWVEAVVADRSSMAEVLRPARVCVLPLPINAYTNLAVAVRLRDLVALGKPIVATATEESARFIEASGSGVAVGESPESMATGILRILSDTAYAAECSRRARVYACDEANTWAARARAVRQRLLRRRA